MNLKLRLHNGHMKRTATIEIDDVPMQDIGRVLDQVHEFCTGMRPQGPAVLTVNTNIKGPDREEIAKAVRDSFARVRQLEVNTAPKEPSTRESSEPEHSHEEDEERSSSLIGEGRTLGVRLGEMYPELKSLIESAADAEGLGENVPGRSGIKFTAEGEPLLLVKYFCKRPGCHNAGLRYVRDGSTFCKCHHCGATLQLRPAAFGKVQHENGYFFIADKLYTEGMGQQ